MELVGKILDFGLILFTLLVIVCIGLLFIAIFNLLFDYIIGIDIISEFIRPFFQSLRG